MPERYTAEMDFKFASKTVVLAIASGSFALSAFAQWQWIDKDGRKVFSDRSPPAEIQDKDILKRPAGSQRQAAAAEAAAAPAVPASRPASAPKLTGKDTELEARKKRAEDEEAAKKKADEEKLAKTRAENCERAKTSMVALKSGVRMASVNAQGEQEVFDDAKRAAETKRVQEIIDSNCSKP